MAFIAPEVVTRKTALNSHPASAGQTRCVTRTCFGTQETGILIGGSHLFLNDEKSSDFSIKCGDSIWRVHKAVLRSRCPSIVEANGVGFSASSSRASISHLQLLTLF